MGSAAHFTPTGAVVGKDHQVKLHLTDFITTNQAESHESQSPFWKINVIVANVGYIVYS